MSVRQTWRVWYWEYGAISFVACIVYTPIIWGTLFYVLTEPGLDAKTTHMILNINATIGSVMLIPAAVWTYLVWKYPTRGDLPEWKEAK